MNKLLEVTPRILSIQSHVVHGYVGNKSAVFPLQVLGFEVDFINTVQFSTHTAYKHIKGNVLDNDELEELVQGLTLNEVDYYTHMLTGYSRSPDSLKQIADIIQKLRKKNPELVYEQKRKECISAANDLTQALVDHLNVGVAQAYLNQKKLDAEAKLLHQGAINFAKQTQQWLALVENFSSALKEIGDVENWARSIENDMKIVTDTLERAYQDSRTSN